MRVLRRHQADPADGGRRVQPPSARGFLIDDTERRQQVLAGCDRSPALLRLELTDDGAGVTVWFRGETKVGRLTAEHAPLFAPEVKTANDAGIEYWVHGQVERRGYDLCVQLRCVVPSPGRRARWRRLLGKA